MFQEVVSCFLNVFGMHRFLGEFLHHLAQAFQCLQLRFHLRHAHHPIASGDDGVVLIGWSQQQAQALFPGGKTGVGQERRGIRDDRITYEDDLFHRQRGPNGATGRSRAGFEHQRVVAPVQVQPVAEGDLRRGPARAHQRVVQLPLRAGFDDLRFEGDRAVTEELHHLILPCYQAFDLARSQRAVKVLVQVDQQALVAARQPQHAGFPHAHVIQAEGRIDQYQSMLVGQDAQGDPRETGFDEDVRGKLFHGRTFLEQVKVEYSTRG